MYSVEDGPATASRLRLQGGVATRSRLGAAFDPGRTTWCFGTRLTFSSECATQRDLIPTGALELLPADSSADDESDDDTSLKHGVDRTAFEIARATKKRKGIPDAVAAADPIHVSATGQTQAQQMVTSFIIQVIFTIYLYLLMDQLAAPVINITPGASSHTAKVGHLG